MGQKKEAIEPALAKDSAKNNSTGRARFKLVEAWIQTEPERKDLPAKLYDWARDYRVNFQLGESLHYFFMRVTVVGVEIHDTTPELGQWDIAGYVDDLYVTLYNRWLSKVAGFVELDKKNAQHVGVARDMFTITPVGFDALAQATIEIDLQRAVHLYVLDAVVQVK